MRKFYLQVTKEHRQKAKRREKEAKAQQSAQRQDQENRDSLGETRETASADPQQNPQQSVSEKPRDGETGKTEEGVLSIRDSDRPELTNERIAAEGLEPPTRGL